ncbi:MAG: histidinol dehydrogenase, partial [Cytophagaceae bacterium]
YGTASIPKVYKIFGPGNQYVTAAKMLVAKEGMAIDMPAGPSEVAVYADDTAVPAFVAADLLSQAEHGADSQVLLVSTSKKMVTTVNLALTTQLERLPRRDLAAKAIENSKAILVETQQDAIDLLNDYAAEHLILSIENAEAVAEKIINAGSIFLGNYTPESAGDYASGTNHTLPTNGFARAYSGVSLDSFVKKITIQHISPEGLQLLGPVVEAMAEAESLDAHKRAVSLRLASLADENPV